ncbi:MAG: hypothetical protein ACTSVU_06535 [Promethearchaeota archaeon]
MVQIQKKKIYDNNIEETVVTSFLTGFTHFQKLLTISFLEIPKIPDRVRNAQNILFRLMVIKFIEKSRPYGNLLNSKQKEKLDPEIASYSDIAAMFLERSINLQENHGVIALLITYAITFSQKWSPLRAHINSAYRTCKIATFDRNI